MADYTRYALPAEEWIQFEKTNLAPAQIPGTTQDQAREQFNDTRAKLFRHVLGPVEEVESIDVSIPTSDSHEVPGRLYHCEGLFVKAPLYIHLHGGGFHLGNLETEDISCRLLALHTRTAVLNLNYRHTPEWTFPTPVQDVWDALNWISSSADKYGIDGSKIIIGGISAGASLACATALRDLKEQGNRIKGVVLTIPPLVHETLFPGELIKDGYTSLKQNADAPILPISRSRAFLEMYKPEPDHPYFSPLILPDEQFHGFPRTCFHIAGLDPLRDEGLLFEEKLRRAGVKATLYIYPGFPHGFMGFPQLKESQKWRENLYEGIRCLLRDEEDA